MAKQSEQTVHSGATVVISIDGTVVGRAQSLQGRRTYGTEPVHEIGGIMPIEHINNRYEGTITLERFLMKEESLASIGKAALGEDILYLGVIDISVSERNKDGSPGNPIVVYHSCTCQEYSEQFRVGAIAGENATFAYLYADRG